MEISNGMNEKKLLIRITSLILFILVLNLLAFRFYWYFSIWWFDMPMHILGGFWVGLVFIWFLKPKDLSFNAVLKIILGALFIGLLWEVFEIFAYNFITQTPFNVLDTLSDLCFDLAGAGLSVFYFARRIMLKQNIEV